MRSRTMTLTDDGITRISGIKVGHFTDRSRATGCTVLLCESGAVGGVDVRGSAPGTRETDLLRAGNLVSEAHAVLLAGGSAFGLDAASGVVRYLAERGVGYAVGQVRIPIVPAAILFDLGIAVHGAYPGLDDGYAACRNATGGPIEEGSVGAGTGATVGKLLGWERAVKGGIGTDSIELGRGFVVGSIVAVNALGSIYDPESGTLVAGPRGAANHEMIDTLAAITSPKYTKGVSGQVTNTTLGVVATNARLSKEEANKLASVAHDGVAMAIRPAHTMSDGDTIFALATGRLDGPADMHRICAAGALSVARAIVRAIQQAQGLDGIPGIADLVR